MHHSQDKVKIKIDDSVIEVPRSYTVIQACEAVGAIIPRFCYHERLSIAGNCRMCLVEVVGTSKPIASCAYGVADLRPPRGEEIPQINTKSKLVSDSRKGVLGFILANHPLDCPICDQGGECDLQDQAMAFGEDRSHYIENKRAVEDKYIGPLVKTSMNRCIHCTRCVRFISEVAGTGDLGATGRGEDTEITTYLESSMTSELQGNVIDLCPVGALTSKPYAFTARPWELTSTKSIDVHDALGSSIFVDSRNGEVMRIRPGLNPEINEEWLADRSRFIWDGLKSSRLDQPWKITGRELRPTSWKVAINTVANELKGKKDKPPRILVLAGQHAGIEEMFALQELLGDDDKVRFESRIDGNGLHPDIAGRSGYTLAHSITDFEKTNAIMLVGCNPRLEAPLLNARIRKAWLDNQCHAAYLGANSETIDLTYPFVDLGDDISALEAIANKVSKNQNHSSHPIVLLGSAAIQGKSAKPALSYAYKIAKNMGALRPDWLGVGVLNQAASQVGALDIGFVPKSPDITFADSLREVKEGEFDIVWLLGADPADLKLPKRETGKAQAKNKRPFVIYQGSHGDIGAELADIILPAAAYTEKKATFVNAEGRVQRTNRAVFPPGEAKEDWTIIRAISTALQKPLPFNNHDELIKCIEKKWPHLSKIGEISSDNISADIKAAEALSNTKNTLQSEKIEKTIEDPYQINPIMRASAVMRDISLRRSSTIKDIPDTFNFDALANKHQAEKQDKNDKIITDRLAFLEQRMGL